MSEFDNKKPTTYFEYRIRTDVECCDNCRFHNLKTFEEDSDIFDEDWCNAGPKKGITNNEVEIDRLGYCEHFEFPDRFGKLREHLMEKLTKRFPEGNFTFIFNEDVHNTKTHIRCNIAFGSLNQGITKILEENLSDTNFNKDLARFYRGIIFHAEELNERHFTASTIGLGEEESA